MPTEVKIVYLIPGVTAKDYYRVTLSEESFAKRFHAEVNGEPNAAVGPWEAGQRSISFHMTLNVPAMVKKIIGTEYIRVEEVTRITWRGDSCFELTTQPHLDFPAANKFTTSGITIVTDTPAGCQVECTLQCSAAMPWPMQSSVESIMASEGKVTVGKYLDYCKQACEEDRNNRAAEAEAEASAMADRVKQEAAAAAAAAAARAPTPPPLQAAPAHDEDNEAWYDIEEDGRSDAGGSATSRSASTHAQPRTAEPAGPLAAYEHLSRDEVALRCLLQIQKSSIETNVLMREVLHVLQSMDANIAAIHAAAVQTKPVGPGAVPLRSYTPSPAAAAAAAVQSTRPSPAVAPPAAATRFPTAASAPSSRTFTYMACACLAGVSLASVMYLRARHRGAGAAGNP